MFKLNTIKRKINSFLYWRKIISKNNWFDYEYLLKLIKHQLELMHKNWHKSHHIDWEKEKEQIGMSLKLLNQYLESEFEMNGHGQEWLEEFLDSLKVMRGWWN